MTKDGDNETAVKEKNASLNQIVISKIILLRKRANTINMGIKSI